MCASTPALLAIADVPTVKQAKKCTLADLPREKLIDIVFHLTRGKFGVKTLRILITEALHGIIFVLTGFNSTHNLANTPNGTLAMLERSCDASLVDSLEFEMLGEVVAQFQRSRDID